MSWIYELLKNRYERKWIPPWKPSDFILWQYGPLRPKNYGEVLFSDEYNYLIYTLYWSKVSKRFFFRGFFYPSIVLSILKIGVTIPPIIYKLIKIIGETRTEFADILLSIISKEVKIEFPDIVNQLMKITSRIYLISGPIFIYIPTYNVGLRLSLGSRLINDLPTKTVEIYTDIFDISQGLVHPNLYLDIVFTESIQKSIERYADVIVYVNQGNRITSAEAIYKENQINIKTLQININIRVE